MSEMTLQQFLSWCLSPSGLSVVVTFLITMLLPDFLGAAWEKLVAPRWRRPMLLLICLVVAAGAVMLLSTLFDVVVTIPGIVWNALVAVFIVYTGDSVATGFRKLPSKTDWHAWRQSLQQPRVAAGPAGDAPTIQMPQQMQWTG